MRKHTKKPGAINQAAFLLLLVIGILAVTNCKKDDELATDRISSLTIDSTLTTVGVGLTAQITAFINQEPNDQAGREEVTWCSRDLTIARIDENGLVTGVSPGKVSITIASRSNPNILDQKIIEVTIGENDIPSVTINEEATTETPPAPFFSQVAAHATASPVSKGLKIIDKGLDPTSQVVPSVVAELRPTLSELNLFQGNNLSELSPSPLVFEYDLNTPSFTDYAKKQRLIALPAGQKMVSQGDGLPDFPDNTVIAKTFYYHVDDRTPSLGKRIIETRILIKKSGLWITGNYLWNASQTEATLTENGSTVDIDFIDGKGANMSIEYEIPTNTDCFSCHQTNSLVAPIGPKLRNMSLVANGKNQLQSLLDKQWLTGIGHPNEINPLPKAFDPGVPPDLRARAYLEVNCAHCHTDGGVCAGPFGPALRMSYETTFADSEIDQFGSSIAFYMDPQRFQEQFRMPLIGTTLPDEEGIDLIVGYINSL